MTAANEPHLGEADYFFIENALMASAKGRSFLREYLDRNRSVEVHKLLRSITRLHRVATGEPGFAASVHRELIIVLHGMRELRVSAPEGSLACGLERVEASLMALTEAVEDRSDGIGGGVTAGSCAQEVTRTNSREMKLFAELASLFSTNSQTGSISRA